MAKEFQFSMGPTREFTLPPYMPEDPSVMFYGRMGNMMIPREYQGWLKETMSWKESCYIHTGLSMRGTWLTIKGPDAVKMLSETTVADYTNMKTGRARHVIFVNKFGHVMGHGVCLRLGEDEFATYGCEQITMYYAMSGRYKLEPCFPKFNDFVFQIGGPRALEVIEAATQEDFHDLKFLNFRYATIAGHKVRILRLGMAGTLAYEIHGTVDMGTDVYDAVYAAGQTFGIQKLGEFYWSYFCQHTENGFPQAFGHFYNAYREDEDFYRWYRQFIIPEHPGVKEIWDAANDICDMEGTLGDTLADYYRNPIELGWGHSIHWDHDFIGKDALMKIRDAGARHPVTLNWNAEDCLDVTASYLREGTPYMYMDYPRDNKYANFQLRVENKDGKVIGVTSFRTYTLYQRKNISLCCIDAEYDIPDNDVYIIWGDRDLHPIKRIRATVSKFPSLDLPRNERYEMESIPRLVKEK